MPTSVPQIQSIERSMMRELPPFRVGDTVRVHYLIREGDKERIQVFQGVVIRKNRGGIGATFTVRKVSFNIGVERIFPLHSPRIDRIQIEARGHVRRSKLYYLRELRGKKARLRESQKETGLEAAKKADLEAEKARKAEAKKAGGGEKKAKKGKGKGKGK